MFRIHIIIIILMSVCGIGFILWGTGISYKTKYQTHSSIATASEENKSKHETTSGKVKPTVTTTHANIKKEEARVQQFNIFEGDMGKKSLPFSREAVIKIALWLQENLSIKITDWQAITGELSPNFRTSMISGLVSNSSYSEFSSYRKSISNLASPLSGLPSGTLSVTVKEMSSETEAESRISGSHGKKNLPKEKTKSNRTSSTGSSSNSSRSNAASDDHGNSPSTGTRIRIGDEVEGEINPEGDRDYFVFDGKAKEVIDIDITAERLGSDLDSYITLFGPDGSRLAYNDDSGYSLDSSISDFELPKTGKYKLEVRDLGNRGGPEFYYNLTIVNP
ncbi:hypothetical protein FJZ31_23370 [Candidatus Poribacteria bacterium]|nr:hypothetical protein [Candidatus Poribacteria bacterium]